MDKLGAVIILTACVSGVVGFSSPFLSDEADMFTENRPKCGQCNESSCFKLQYCVAVVVKDHCGCCNVCSTDVYQANVRHDSPARRESPCSSVTCPKHKVCMENMQGLPLCTCPSIYKCRRKKREVCGTDNLTYHSRCHLRIAACKLGKRLRVRHKEACTKEEMDSEQQPIPKKRKHQKKGKRKRKKKHKLEKNDKVAKKLEDEVGRQRDGADVVVKRKKKNRRRQKRRQKNSRRKRRQYKSRRVSKKYKLLPYRF